MSSLSKRIESPLDRRAGVRQCATLLGSAITLDGAKSVIVEDICPSGAKIVGRLLPAIGKEILLRTSHKMVLGRIAWAKNDHRGVVVEEGTLARMAVAPALK